MRARIVVVWTAGLLGALTATLVILKEVALILHALKSILRLAEYTREAARGVDNNLTGVSRLEALEEPSRNVTQASAGLASAAASMDAKLVTVAADGTQEGE